VFSLQRSHECLRPVRVRWPGPLEEGVRSLLGCGGGQVHRREGEAVRTAPAPWKVVIHHHFKSQNPPPPPPPNSNMTDCGDGCVYVLLCGYIIESSCQVSRGASQTHFKSTWKICNSVGAGETYGMEANCKFEIVVSNAKCPKCKCKCVEQQYYSTNKDQTDFLFSCDLLHN